MPLTIRNDTFKIKKAKENALFKYFARVPIAGRRGGIWLPLYIKDFQEKDLEECKIRDSRIRYSNGTFLLHLVIKKEIEDNTELKKDKVAFISIDLGERNPAVSVTQSGNSMKPRFYRENIRSVRAHYRVLKQNLGKKKLLKKIKQTRDKEGRITKDINHRISNAIVSEAKKLIEQGFQPVITMGNLKNIRQHTKKKGRRFRRMINQWGYYQLQQFIRYKANWNDIVVALVPEYKTSKTCHNCGAEGLRRGSLFKCKNCSKQYNADINGAINICTRSSEYIFEDRASVTMPMFKTYDFELPEDKKSFG